MSACYGTLYSTRQLCADTTPILGLERTIVVCDTLVVSTGKFGTWIAVVYSPQQEQVFDTLELLTREELLTLARLADGWHGSFDDLLNAAKELA